MNRYLLAIKRRLRFYKNSRKDNIKLFYFNKCMNFDPIINDKLEFITITNLTEFNNLFLDNNYLHNSDVIKRFEKKSIFLALLENGMCVSSGWLSYKSRFWISEIDLSFDMKNSNVGILYDFYTKKEYRNKGYYSKLIRKIVENSKSIQEFIIYTRVENIPSEKGILKAGFKELGNYDYKSVIKYLNGFGFKKYRRRSRFYGLYFTRNL